MHTALQGAERTLTGREKKARLTHSTRVVKDPRCPEPSYREDHRFHSLTRLGLDAATDAGFGRHAARPLVAAPTGPRAVLPARARAAHRVRPRSATVPP